MPLPFRPNCLPTALGSLPHPTARAAWESCLQHLPAVLPLPLLAGHGEQPASLAADGLGGATIRLDQLRFDREAAFKALDGLYLAYLQNQWPTRALDLAALDEWTARESQVRRAQAVSTLLMGPVSLALRLVDEAGRPALVDNVIVDALVKHLYLRLRWQHAVIGRTAQVVLQWLYEPYFDIIGTPFSPVDWPVARHAVEETFGGGSGVRGVWVGASTDMPALLRCLGVEVVGIPLPDPAVAEGWADALRDFIARGGVIGWGIVPQTADGLAQTRVGRLGARFGAVLRALESAGLPPGELVGASLIMPEDILGNLSPAEADAVLAVTGQLSGMLRHTYGLD